jgi:O-antigen biosynthesis protein
MEGSVDPPPVPPGPDATVEAARLRAELRQTEAARRDLERQLAALAADLLDARARLAAVYASRSWRLTAPVRRFLGACARPRPAAPAEPAPASAPRGVPVLTPSGTQSAGPAELTATVPQASVIALSAGAGGWPALDALCACAGGMPFEVLLALPEGTSPPPARPGLRPVPVAAGLSPSALCNTLAASAAAPRLVLWDGAAPPRPDWLGALADALDRFEDAGMSGAVLLDAAGRVAAAGCAVADDGALVPLLAGASPDDPDLAHVAPVPALPPGAVMLPTALWRGLSGLDAEIGAIGPALADLARRIAESGRGVRRTPFARLRAPDAPPAADAWAEATGRWHLRRRRADAARHTQTSRPRVLLIDHFVPTPDRDSGSGDVHAFLRLFEGLGYDATMFALDDSSGVTRYVDDLRRRGVRVLQGGGFDGLRALLAREGTAFDLVLIYRVALAFGEMLEALRAHSPRARLVFNTVDLHFVRLEREAMLRRSAEALDEAYRVQQQEMAAMLRTDATIVMTPAEQQRVAALLPDVRTYALPIVRDIPGPARGFDGRRGALFVGGFRHRPNADAIEAFLRDVWPLVRQRLDIGLTIVGADPPDVLRALADPSVTVAGFVPDLDPLLGTCRLTVAPLRYGAGMKGKVVTSLAAGVPCVASPIAAEGTGLADGTQIRVADSPEAFAEAIVQVHESREVWERLSQGGLAAARERFSLPAVRRRLVDMLHDLGLPTGMEATLR